MGATIVYGRPCENCGHRPHTRYEGLPDDVAAMLKAAFVGSGLTRAELCRRADLSPGGSYIENLMAGTARPSKPVARDLIRALDMSSTDGQRLLAASGSERDRRSRRAA
jgi:hypothetical protein